MPIRTDRHDPLQPDRFERQEGRADGDGVGDREVAHVVGEDRRVDPHRVAGRRDGVPDHRTATPVTNMASVASMNGAPRIAPTPTSCDDSPVANRIAMIGIIVSGSAVPTAASTDPTAPSASPSLRPNHSMPLVNSSAPSRMMTKRADEDEDVHASDGNSEGAADADGDDDEDPDRRSRPSAGRRRARRRRRRR